MSSYLALKIGYINKTNTHIYTKWTVEGDGGFYAVVEVVE